MSAAKRQAALVLWIDVPSNVGNGTTSPGGDAADRFWGLLNARELPATWTFADLASGRLLWDRLLDNAVHEAAIRAVPATRAVESSRDGQIKQVTRQLAAAAREGCPASSLVLAGNFSAEIAAALRRAGVRSIRVERAVPAKPAGWRAWLGQLAKRRTVRAAKPRVPQRHGLWEMAVSARLIEADQSSRTSLTIVGREIELAARERGVCHAVIELAQCEQLAKRDWRRIESLFDEIAERRSSSGLKVLTAAQLAAEYAAATRGVPARSILRRAA
ncbi:MAG: hypothetical protein AB7U73_17420 [Pirellulales bacterium]